MEGTKYKCLADKCHDLWLSKNHQEPSMNSMGSPFTFTKVIRNATIDAIIQGHFSNNYNSFKFLDNNDNK